jgi:hypothetical protein
MFIGWNGLFLLFTPVVGFDFINSKLIKQIA